MNDQYRKQFAHTYDQIFVIFQDEFESYALRSEEMYDKFTSKQMDISILHRDGGYIMVTPSNESVLPVEVEQLPLFRVYR